MDPRDGNLGKGECQSSASVREHKASGQRTVPPTFLAFVAPLSPSWGRCEGLGVGEEVSRGRPHSPSPGTLSLEPQASGSRKWRSSLVFK